MKYEVLKVRKDTLKLKICRDIYEEVRKGYIKSVLNELGIDGKIIDFNWDGDIKVETNAVLEIIFDIDLNED